MALSKAKIDQLGEHLKQGQYANAEDMITLKELVDYEVNTRRHQNYKITNEVPKKFGQFDTAKFINNLLGGLKKLNNRKFDLVIQNYTFIRALYEIWRKIKKLMEYEEYTKYSDNAGCDGECRGLCSSCSSSCVGGNSGKTSSGGTGGNCSYYCDPGFACPSHSCSTVCTPLYSQGGNPNYGTSIIDGYVKNDDPNVDGNASYAGANGNGFCLTQVVYNSCPYYCPSFDNSGCRGEWRAEQRDCGSSYKS